MTRRLAVVFAVPGLLVAVLYVALPGNETAAQGPADPLLGLRTRVVGLLRAAGVMDEPFWMPADPWLPSGSASETRNERDAVDWRQSVRREPVYRGLLFPVGDRLTMTVELGEGYELGRALRIWYERDGVRTVIATATRAGGGIATNARRGTVTGFVPRGIDAFGYDEILEDGTNRGGSSWGFR